MDHKLEKLILELLMYFHLDMKLVKEYVNNLT